MVTKLKYSENDKNQKLKYYDCDTSNEFGSKIKKATKLKSSNSNKLENSNCYKP